MDRRSIRGQELWRWPVMGSRARGDNITAGRLGPVHDMAWFPLVPQGEELTLKTSHLIVLLAVLMVAGGIVGVKVLRGSAPAGATPMPTESPVAEAQHGSLLLFNKSMGCICALKLYAAADKQFDKLDPELAGLFNARRLDAYESEDLVAAHQIIVAPTLIVLDRDGREVMRQESKVNIATVEETLREMLASEGDS